MSFLILSSELLSYVRQFKQDKKKLLEFLKPFLVKTNDDTYTLASEQGELMHSQVGCFVEALEKFVYPTKIKDNCTILDLCSGLGYNSAAALSVCTPKHIDMVEFSSEFTYLSTILPLEEKWKHPFNIVKKYYRVETPYEKSQLIRPYFGDARKIVPTIRRKL